MEFVWNQIAIKKIFFPNDVGLPPALLKHVSDRSELILKQFIFFVKNLYGICMESNCHTFHIMNLYDFKFSFYGKDPGLIKFVFESNLFKPGKILT